MSPNRVVICAAAAAAIVVAVVVTGFELGGRPAPRASRPGPAASRPSVGAGAAAAAGPAVVPGPDGAQARWVIQENDKPGTTAWQIRGSPGGISGFASQVYARQGQPVTLYVSTTGPAFRAEAFRMGYYQGKGARLVWESGLRPGTDQPACPVTSGINMVACDNCPRR